MDQIRALRYKRNRHLKQKEQLCNDDLRKQLFETLESDWNRNIANPVKQWTGASNVFCFKFVLLTMK